MFDKTFMSNNHLSILIAMQTGNQDSREVESYIYCPICISKGGMFGLASLGTCKSCKEIIGSCSNKYCYACSIKLKTCYACGKSIMDGDSYLKIIEKNLANMTMSYKELMDEKRYNDFVNKQAQKCEDEKNKLSGKTIDEVCLLYIRKNE